jgi:hypothetical protein
MTHVCSVYSPLCLIRGTRAVMAPLHGRANPSRCGSGQWGPSEPPMHANVLCSSFRPTEGPQAGRSRCRRPRYTTFFHHTYTHTTTSINKHTHTHTTPQKYVQNCTVLAAADAAPDPAIYGRTREIRHALEANPSLLCSTVGC